MRYIYEKIPYTAEQLIEHIDDSIEHIASDKNPHGVTAEQTGAYTTEQTDELLAQKADLTTFRSQSGDVSPAVSYYSEKEGHLFSFDGEKSRCSTGIEYESNGDGTCYVKGKGSCTDSAIVLPIYSPDGDLVTTVGKDNNTLAFSGDTSIECVILSKSIKTVYVGSFAGCTNLETLMITNCDTQFILNAISELKYLKKLYYNGTYESFEENGYTFAFQKFGIAPKVFFSFSENLKPDIDKKVDVETFTAHEEDTGNPHGVTAEQTGAYDKAAVDGMISAIRSASLGGLTFSIAENGILTITKED